jgi:uncharacterized protein
LKFLLFLCVILFGVWLWRKNRLNDLKQRSEKTVDPQTPQAKQPSAMLACLHCGVHMPEVDMYRGKKGVYCSHAHCHAAADQAATPP